MKNVESNKNFIVGYNSVLECLRNKSEINFIIYSSNVPKEIQRLSAKKKIPLKYCDHKKLNRMFKNINHQGIAAQISSRNYVEIDDILNLAKNKNESPFIVILDKIQDPHNFGAISRTAECMGVHGIIIGKRNCVSISPTVEKCSCGALEHLMIARADSLSKTCDLLKKSGVWICGADMNGENFNNFSNLYKQPLALVIGSEGFGISENVKKKCDFIASIPMFGKINSLNASVASAIFMQKISEKKHM